MPADRCDDPLARLHAVRGVRFKTWRQVGGLASLERHPMQVPELTAGLVAQVDDRRAIGRHGALEDCGPRIGQAPELTGDGIPGICLLVAIPVAEDQTTSRIAPRNRGPQDLSRSESIAPVHSLPPCVAVGLEDFTGHVGQAERPGPGKIIGQRWSRRPPGVSGDGCLGSLPHTPTPSRGAPRVGGCRRRPSSRRCGPRRPAS